MLNYRARSSKGTALAELALGCLLTVTLALFALDIGTAMISYSVTDRACRDAARAAAQGTNAGEATNLANKIVQNFAVGGGLISAPRVVSVQYNDFGGAPPDGVSPTVTVTTQCKARAIAPLSIFGKTVGGGSFPLTKTYTFPIVRLTVKPS